MGYLFVWQLIAHHSSTGFMLWVTDDRPAQARLEEEQLGYLTEYNQLSDEINAFRKCQTNQNSVY